MAVLDVAGVKVKRKRRPKPGDTQALRRTLWSAIRRVEQVMDSPGTEPATLLRCVSALATVGGVYLKAEEQAEIITRLKDLERAVRGQLP
jgi:hypothetical protein